MDPTTLRYYDDELRHLRDVAWEFAQEHEKIGSRLALDRNGCGDPYVERLMEGLMMGSRRGMTGVVLMRHAHLRGSCGSATSAW